MSWKSIVKNLAPTIAAGLGGPMAGTAVKFLSNKLLGKDNGSEAEIAQTIMSASPEQLARVREIDNEFAVEMAKLDVDVFKLQVEDRKSAREMAKSNMWPQITLSVIFIGGYFALVFMLFSGTVKVTPEIRDMTNILLGVLTASIPSIMQFWFGSSSGSKDKTAKMRG